MNTEKHLSDPETTPTPEEKKKPRPPSAALLALEQQLVAMASSEEKIRAALQFMRSALSQEEGVRFEDFWGARRLCLPYFKEALTPKERSELWGQYVELAGEARRLKEILDERAAFAVEQIDIAIQALEKELEQYGALIQQASPLEFPEALYSLLRNKDLYQSVQGELSLLNAVASRVSGLRKEVMKTGMRVRLKNRLFEKLSEIGDRIFPRRKELIKAISEAFTADIEAFVHAHFTSEGIQGPPLYVLREEIKAFQAFSKLLSLNSQAFNTSREKLSVCWDQLKNVDKERKKEITQKRQQFKENLDQVLARVQALAEECGKGEITKSEADKRADEVLQFARTFELGREEFFAVKDALRAALQPILEKARQEELLRKEQEQQAEEEKRKKIENLKERAEALMAQKQLSYEHVIHERDQLQAEIKELTLNKMDKQAFDRLFKQIRDALDEKKQQALLALPPEDLEALDKLKAAFEEWKQARREIKEQLENYRRLLGGSGFDFEKGMMYRELMEAEKVRLEKTDASIAEIEEKIAEIESGTSE